MKKFLNSASAMLSIALIWGCTWGGLSVVTGIILESFSPFSLEKHVDPMAAIAMPGFFMGIIFYWIIRINQGSIRISSYSLQRLLMWGAVIGLAAGSLTPLLGTPNPNYEFWQIILTLATSSTILSMIAALATGIIFRFTEKHSKF